MEFLFLSALALILLPASTFAIYGGKIAAIGQFPYQIRLSMVDTEDHWTSCGGSIIGVNWCLTAAHCLAPYVDIESVSIYMGTNKRSPTGYEPMVVSKEHFIVHKNYSRFTKRNDIALIKTPALTFSRLIQPVKLPPMGKNYDLDIYDYKTFIISGWGQSDNSESDLQYLEMIGVPIDECIKIHYYRKIMINRERNVCTAAANKESTCFGDSGGPLVMNETNSVGRSTVTQYGIVSVGTSDVCGDGKPNVFTRIDFYLDWILEHTGISY